ncbi:MAG: PIN domain-containing protein [Proteobacteria bacterium]|nr:PIN domain-containing protein [Pseudomonadota bacterium]MDA0850741.1 PIN domain-containing protein [Pseudomonadota bacterium]MDA1294747.1 PIN domain-containing protein [Pseudomonadota bacterium]
MKLLFDTCVLYPTVMREMLMGTMEISGDTPFWSERILEEWARAARKIGPTGEAQARTEIALLRARWPKAEAIWAASLEARLWLPDENDKHVLAAAIASSADLIVTLNKQDFPRGTLREEGLDRIDPDTLLMQIFQWHEVEMKTLAGNLTAKACALSGKSWEVGPLLKKARLPRLAKALARSSHA